MTQHTVFVTGATAGIGRAIASRYLEEGAKVIALGRRKERLEELRAPSNQDSLFLCPLDLTDGEALSHFLETLPPEFQEITILVNNAGAAYGMEPSWSADLKDWERMIDLNVTSLLRLTRWILPGMVERNRGHIVNLGSVAGTYPYSGGNVYGATKAFLEQFSLNLRCDLHGKRIRVSNIEPGLVETEFSMVRFAGDRQKAEAVYQGIEAMTAEDIAEAVFWCTSIPERVNVNRMELMATMQTPAGFRFERS